MDLLLLLNKPKRDNSDFENYAYPIMEKGFDLLQYFSVHTYTKDEWYNPPHSMFYLTHLCGAGCALESWLVELIIEECFRDFPINY